MPTQIPLAVYQSGDWEIDLVRRELRRRGIVAPLGSRAFEILEILVQANGELVNKYDIIDRVWRGVLIGENTLHAHVTAVRRALGIDREILKTEAGRGYRLLGTWTSEHQNSPVSAVRPEARKDSASFGSSFPAGASALIGRENIARQLRDYLSAYRMVTLTGPGGIGKTVLALDVARGLLQQFDGGGFFVELASLSDPGLVPTAVANCLGLRIGGEKISSELIAKSIGLSKALLVIDNCEHVIDAVADISQTLLGKCPFLSILATSREVLSIDGEYVSRVPPLDVPPDDGPTLSDVLSHSAAQLLLARISALDSQFSPKDQHLASIVAICRQLDGIPLAIEFAAARSATLGLREVAERLGDRFGLLTGGRRALPRHRTLRATIDWSYDLLTESERKLLRRVAVFPPGFTLNGAIAVMKDFDISSGEIAEGVASLVGKSFATLDGKVSPSRWRLLETTRAYALEKLIEAGELNQAAQRHAEFFRDLFISSEKGSPARAVEDDGDMASYAGELDNVRAALDWSFSPDGNAEIGVVLTAAFAPALLNFELNAEWRERAERALQRMEPGMDVSLPLQMELYNALGFALAFTFGDRDRTAFVTEKALEIAENIGDLHGQLKAYWYSWIRHFASGNCRPAQEAARRFARVGVRTLEPSVAFVGDRLLGNALQHEGRLKEAEESLRRLLDHYVAPTTKQYLYLFQYDQRPLTQAMLVRVIWLQGFVDQAIEQARACLEDARNTHYGNSACWILLYASYPVALMTGDLDGAEQALSMLLKRATNLHSALWKFAGTCLEGKLLIARGEFSPGVALLRNALDSCEQSGWTFCYPEFMCALAEGLGGLAQYPQALDTIDRALASADSGFERWYVPELLRLKGILILREAHDKCHVRALDCFEEALTVARMQGALFWELRAATCLARLYVDQKNSKEARMVLAPTFSRLTEGFATPDMRAAQELLDSLPTD
jgi:predicted ATPase/DNA-binding winged helix-turn-helix (wHTH) protein